MRADWTPSWCALLDLKRRAIPTTRARRKGIAGSRRPNADGCHEAGDLRIYQFPRIDAASVGMGRGMERVQTDAAILLPPASSLDRDSSVADGAGHYSIASHPASFDMSNISLDAMAVAEKANDFCPTMQGRRSERADAHFPLRAQRNSPPRTNVGTDHLGHGARSAEAGKYFRRPGRVDSAFARTLNLWISKAEVTN